MLNGPRPRVWLFCSQKPFTEYTKSHLLIQRTCWYQAGLGDVGGWQNASVPFLRAGAWSHGTHAKYKHHLLSYLLYWVELQISSIIQVANIIVKKTKWWYNKLHRLSDMPINQYQAKFSSVDLPEICHKLYVYLTPWTRPLNIPCTVYTMNQWLLNWYRGYF